MINYLKVNQVIVYEKDYIKLKLLSIKIFSFSIYLIFIEILYSHYFHCFLLNQKI
jgi:hypothetical protein